MKLPYIYDFLGVIYLIAILFFRLANVDIYLRAVFKDVKLTYRPEYKCDFKTIINTLANLLPQQTDVILFFSSVFIRIRFFMLAYVTGFFWATKFVSSLQVISNKLNRGAWYVNYFKWQNTLHGIINHLNFPSKSHTKLNFAIIIRLILPINLSFLFLANKST